MPPPPLLPNKKQKQIESKRKITNIKTENKLYSAI